MEPGRSWWIRFFPLAPPLPSLTVIDTKAMLPITDCDRYLGNVLLQTMPDRLAASSSPLSSRIVIDITVKMRFVVYISKLLKENLSVL
jgi:hypothetical protein